MDLTQHIDLALKTWYPKDHPLHLDPMHPAIKLAGEAGEILDQWGKHLYKPGRECNQEKFLDELGDLWYYIRILVYQNGYNNQNRYNIIIDTLCGDTTEVLTEINFSCAMILNRVVGTNSNCDKFLSIQDYIDSAILWLVQRLTQLDYTLDELTELNYQKLNSDPTNHGWKGAGQT